VRNRLIICGWYRDENAHWVPQLTRYLEAYRHQHDFVHGSHGDHCNLFRTIKVAGELISRCENRADGATLLGVAVCRTN